MKIWIVEGRCGHYPEERMEWYVCAYQNQMHAEAHAAAACDEAVEIQQKLIALQKQSANRSKADYWREDERIRKSSKFDPNMEVDTMDCPWYNVDEVDLREEFDPQNGDAPSEDER